MLKLLLQNFLKISLSLFLLTITSFSKANEINKVYVNLSNCTVTIKVANDKGIPLEGVNIYIHELKLALITDKNGKAQQDKIPLGKYLMEVTLLGFSNYTQTINLQANTTISIILSEAVADHGEVTVTGVSNAQKVKHATQSISIIKKNDLLQNSSTNIIEGLSKKALGLNLVSTGPAIAKPIVRGVGYNRITIINDGIKQEGQQWGDEHGIEIDENSVQKAEVLKGPASLMYGSDALGGVINIITNTPVSKGMMKGTVGYSFLDNNSLHNVFGNIGSHFNNGINFNVYGTYKSAKDYKNKYDGSVLNSRYTENNFGGYIGLNKPWGYSHIIISSFNQKLGLVEGERDKNSGKFLIFSGTSNEHIATSEELNSRSLNVPFQKINHLKIALDNQILLSKGRLNFIVAYQQNNRKEMGDYLLPNAPTLFFNLQTYSYNFQYHFPIKNEFKTSIGINGMYQTNDNKASEVLIPAYNLFDAGLFIYTQKTFRNFTVSGGLRGDMRKLNTQKLVEGADIRFNKVDKNFENFTGSIGLAYDMNKLTTLKLNLAKGFRAPTVAELCSNGAHEGTDRYELGNESLKSETSLQFDVGFIVNSKHVSFELAGFYNTIHNYIYYSKLESNAGGDSLITNTNGTFSAFKFNQKNAALYGFESKLDIHPHPIDWLHIENSFAMVIGKFNTAIEGNKNIPFIPAALLKSEIRTDIKQLNNYLRNGYFKIELENNFAQKKAFTIYNTETFTSAYSLLNIGLGTDIFLKTKKLMSLYCCLNNLTDVAYQSHLSRLKYTATNNVTGRTGVFNMGRNISLKLIFPIEKSLVKYTIHK